MKYLKVNREAELRSHHYLLLSKWKIIQEIKENTKGKINNYKLKYPKVEREYGKRFDMNMEKTQVTGRTEEKRKNFPEWRERSSKGKSRSNNNNKQTKKKNGVVNSRHQRSSKREKSCMESVHKFKRWTHEFVL